MVDELNVLAVACPDPCILEVLERVSLSRADIQYLERNTSYNEKEIKEWFRSGKSGMEDY